MIDINQACKTVCAVYPDKYIGLITEYPDMWVFDMKYKEKGGYYVADITRAPMVMKKDGTVAGFFTPDYAPEYLQQGKDISIPTAYVAEQNTQNYCQNP